VINNKAVRVGEAVGGSLWYWQTCRTWRKVTAQKRWQVASN